jgi:hypothetical protein
MKKLIISIAIAISFSAYSQPIPVEKPEHLAYRFEANGYDIEINQVREKAGVDKLNRSAELDSYCFKRCLILLEIFLSSDHSYYDFYGKSLFLNPHAGSLMAENYFQNIKNSFSYGNDTLEFAKYINGKYNVSPGHYKNRVNPIHKNYGTAMIIIHFKAINPDLSPHKQKIRHERSIPHRLILTYEAFN